MDNRTPYIQASTFQRMNYHISSLPFAPKCPNAPKLGDTQKLPPLINNSYKQKDEK